MRPLLTFVVLLLLAAGPASAAPSAEPAMVLRGKVVDMSGTAVTRARLVIEAAKKRNSTNADGNGAFAVMLPLPTPERLRAAPCSVRVFATAKGMRLVLPNGDPALSVHLRIERADSADRVVARSNDERVAAMAALAVATRRPLAEVEGLRMMGLEGERVGDPPSVAMPHIAQVAVTPLPSTPVAVTPDAKKSSASSSKTQPSKNESAKKTDPKKTDPAKTVASTTPSSTKASSTKSSSTKSSSTKSTSSKSEKPAETATATTGTVIMKTISPFPGTPATMETIPPAPAPAPPPAAGDCGCRIKGTVELVSNPPPTEPVSVLVWVDGAPGLRSAVELALGSPRPFELLDVPCGSILLRVQVGGNRVYVPQSTHALEGLSCSRGGLLQPRIVLVPRKGS